MIRLTGGKIVTDGKVLQGFDILTEDGKIVDVVPTDASADAVDLSGKYIAPGFIELHCHGAVGYEFMDGTEEAYFKICEKM